MDPTSPRHYPLLAPSLSGFPKTYVVTAEHDLVRDDGRVLAKRLAEESRNPNGELCVKEDYYPGLPHYFHWFPSLTVTNECLDKAVNGIRWVSG
jgi:acetyl esterase/lipase